MITRFFAACIALAELSIITLTPCVSEADVYVRMHKDGRKEFTNRPSGQGWIFYMTESGDQLEIRFEKAEGQPKSIDEIVSEISSKFGIEASLVKAIITVESNCRPSAVSPKGAQGLMQLMPRTAQELKVSQPLDPRENIVGGVKYIKGLLASYGDLRLALAAYNAGPGAVEKYAGIPPYRETINYVKKVLKYYRIYKSDPTLKIAGS
ncbi:MAG: lytic transglycosylase domain-containing protein [Thermodesulfobacteriota bacterium]